MTKEEIEFVKGILAHIVEDKAAAIRRYVDRRGHIGLTACVQNLIGDVCPEFEAALVEAFPEQHEIEGPPVREGDGREGLFRRLRCLAPRRILGAKIAEER